MNDIIVGVDGGGTRTSLIAMRRNGERLAAGTGAGINFNLIGMDEARRNLWIAVDELLKKIGADGYEQLCIGMSALDGPPEPDVVKAFAGDLFDDAKISMNSDVYMALMGVTLGGAGVMVISGTGAMVVGADERGEIHTRAGWGYLLGDRGSAYHLATEGLKAAIDYWEGMAYQTALAEAALRFFGITAPRDIIQGLYSPTIEINRLARFAVEVIGAARAGDAAAMNIVDGTLHYLAVQAAAVHALCSADAPVGIYGGTFQNNVWIVERFNEKLLMMRPQARIGFPEIPPHVGAVIPYFRKAGLWSDEILINLRAWAKGEACQG